MSQNLPKMLHKGVALLAIAAAALIIGCGGGGGGGGSTNSTSTTATSSTATTAATAGTDGSSITQGVYGQVLDSVSNPLQGVTVKFYNSSGSKVGSGQTNAKGNYALQLPTSAVQFTIDPSTMANPGDYFAQFTFKSDDYLTNDTSCLATGPTIQNGQKKPVSTVALTPRWLGPPPPPSGCLTAGG